MILTNKNIAKALGPNVKKARLKKGFTQDYVAENLNISIDLLRNIENGRNVGSVSTLLNLCNFFDITPNVMFESLYKTNDNIVDSNLLKYFNSLSNRSKKTLQQIIIHIDKNY